MEYGDNFIPFSRPSIGEEEEQAARSAMRSGWLTTGNAAPAFEKEVADYTGMPFALTVNSATSGLILAMEACGVGPEKEHGTKAPYTDKAGKTGGKILTTPYTFVSTASAARKLGGEVVYADIEKDSYNIDPAAVEKKLSEDPSIRAVVPVHVGGNLCDMDRLRELARAYEVKLIEDAAHAFPSRTAAGFGGTLGDIGVFSFYATKTITTAEGGMICTKDEQLMSRMKTMRMHGIDRPVWDRYTSDKASWEYDVTEAGFKFNMPDILAAIGREQLKKADRFYEKRREIAGAYNNAFMEYDFLQIPPDGEGNAWHLYLLRIVPEKLNIGRDEFARILQELGLGISMHFIPHFRMTYWKNRYGLRAEDFPRAQRQFETTISLPLWPGMTTDMISRVLATVVETGKDHYAP